MSKTEKWIRAADIAQAIHDYGDHAIECGCPQLDMRSDIIALEGLVDHIEGVWLPAAFRHGGQAEGTGND